MKIFYTWLFISLGLLVPLMSQTLVVWPLNPDKLQVPEIYAPEVDAFDFVRGNGLSVLQFSGSGVSASNWSTATTAEDAAVDYYEFGLKAIPGETLDISSIQFSERRSSSGPLQFRIFASTDGFNTKVELAHETLPDNIFNRSHSFTVDRKIRDGESLMFRFYGFAAESNSGSWTLLANRLKVIGSAMPACTPPTTAASLSLVDVGTNTANIRLEGGSGEARLVVIAPEDAVLGYPYQGDAYTGDLMYGEGDELGVKSYVLAATTDMLVDLPVEGLDPGSAYQVAVFEYNVSQMCYAENPMHLEFSTNCDLDSRAVTVSEFTGLNELVALRWDAPLCTDQYLVLASENPIVGVPLNDSYEASLAFGVVPPAAEFSAGTYPVYFGDETDPLWVGNLENGTTYHFAIFTQNQGEWSLGHHFSATPQEGCPDNRWGEQIFINELHYNNGPVRQDIGVEIAGPAATDLGPYELAVYRVLGNFSPIYLELFRLSLEGAIDDEGAGFGAVWFPLAELPEARGMVVLINSITGEIVERIAYDNRFGLYEENGFAQPQPIWVTHPQLVELASDSPGFSLQRIGDGTCSGDFLWARLPNTRGSLNIGQAILPVELTKLGAEPVGKTARIFWQTATESGSDYFILERSADGRQFEEIGEVQAAGFSVVNQDYEFIDRQPLAGQNFYRLRQFDYDGTAYNLGIVSVNFDSGGKPELGAFPNPVVDQTTAQWNIEAEQLSLFDAHGRLIQQWSLNAAVAGGSQAIDLSTLPAGNYFLSIESKHEILTRRIVKN